MPEPLSLSIAVLTIVTTAISVTQTIHGYASKYTDADLDIAGLRNECATVRLALVQIQRIQSWPSTEEWRGDEIAAEIREDYENVLGSCDTIFSVLHGRLKSFNLQPLNGRSRATAGARFRYTWNEQQIETLRMNIRGLVGALNLLLTAMQSDTITKTHNLLRNHENVHILKSVSDCAESLRSSQAAKKLVGIHSGSANELISIIGDEEFDFDDELINAKAYRRVLNNHMATNGNRGGGTMRTRRTVGMTSIPRIQTCKHLREASKLARNLFSSCRMSIELFSSIACEIEKLSVGLEILENNITSSGLYEEQVTNILRNVSECYDVLLALQGLLHYYETLPSSFQLSWQSSDTSRAQVGGFKKQLAASVASLTYSNSSLSSLPQFDFVETESTGPQRGSEQIWTPSLISEFLKLNPEKDDDSALSGQAKAVENIDITPTIYNPRRGLITALPEKVTEACVQDESSSHYRSQDDQKTTQGRLMPNSSVERATIGCIVDQSAGRAGQTSSFRDEGSRNTRNSPHNSHTLGPTTESFADRPLDGSGLLGDYENALGLPRGYDGDTTNPKRKKGQELRSGTACSATRSPQKALIAATEAPSGGLRTLIVPDSDPDPRVKDLALYEAAKFGKHEIVQSLLNKGAKVDARYKSRRTALHIASRHGHDTTAQLLLKNGADINSNDESGRKALYYASSNGCEDVIRLLLKNGADINSKDKWGWTALHAASAEGYKKVVQLLLENRADMSSKDEYGVTALHIASMKGHEKTIQLLLKNGADINIKDIDENTALHVASFEGHEKVVQLLLENEADIDSKAKNGWTALHAATMEGHEKIVGLLLENGADIMSRNGTGHTALDLAVKAEKANIADTLRAHESKTNEVASRRRWFLRRP